MEGYPVINPELLKLLSDVQLGTRYVATRARYIRRAKVFGVNHPATLSTELDMAQMEDELWSRSTNPDMLG